MIVIKNRIIPFPGFKCLNFFGILFVREDASPMTEVDYNHEAIHTRQIWELLGIFFYLWYGIEWLIRFFQYSPSDAYYNISFEREAYTEEKNLEFLDNRPFWNFIKFL